MRLPTESQLSREQKEVIGAPIEGTTLVVGPPGSGKTVAAMLRKAALQRRRATVVAVAFNNVLTVFTDNERTFDSWLNDWWRRATASRFPAARQEDGHWSKDYAKATDLVRSTAAAALRENGHWGHLILDEAQDFPVDAHRLLFQIQQKVFATLPEMERPSVLLLADENQRITHQNSTIDQIRSAYAFLTPDDEYVLRRNYRNTRAIAEFAAHFYVGLSSGRPELPTAMGDLPRVVAADLDASVDRIATYARAHPNEQIGVLAHYDQTRRKLFNKLAHRLKQTDIVVQTYSSKQKQYHDASGLIFDRPGVVTVLCFASGKGLEFDCVFLPDLQTLPLEGVERDMVRMNLYVMCSRARSQLWLSIDDESREHEVWSLLPPRSLWVAER